jgi:putative flippase GtrA
MTKPYTGEFLRFCLVGFMGFVADAAALELLVYACMPVPLARICSILFALQVTYVAHSRFTFRHLTPAPLPTLRRWPRYMLANLMGAMVNYAVFYGTLSLALLAQPLLNRQFALIAGTAVALVFNYWANRRYVFTRTG